MRYTVVLLPDCADGGYVVHIPALPGCVTQGETLDEGLVMAEDAIKGYLEVLIERGEPIPIEAEGAVIATVGARVAAQVA